MTIELSKPEKSDSEWAYPVAYNIGDEVSHVGIDYACLQAHTSQQSRAPDVTPSLWSVI